MGGHCLTVQHGLQAALADRRRIARITFRNAEGRIYSQISVLNSEGEQTGEGAEDLVGLSIKFKLVAPFPDARIIKCGDRRRAELFQNVREGANVIFPTSLGQPFENPA